MQLLQSQGLRRSKAPLALDIGLSGRWDHVFKFRSGHEYVCVINVLRRPVKVERPLRWADDPPKESYQNV